VPLWQRSGVLNLVNGGPDASIVFAQHPLLTSVFEMRL
jgi:hypothetical protein